MVAGSVERIAHYRILRRVGRGGMGIVYRAVDERDGRVVALKVIRESEASGDEASAHVSEARVRFEREAGILKGLLHVNIVSFYEIGEEDGTPWLAMEFLEGLPITSYGGRPYPETLPLLIQAANGLEVLATRGIVHRDLSPDNIFVVESGGERIVKLLDFGIAKLFETPTGLESLTATGFFLGKVAYGSPEQLGALGHGAVLDWRSDVYSLGVIFYQVLSGRRPFEGKAPVEYIAAHLNLPAPPVAAPAGAPPLPMGLVRLIDQMLEKRREDRPRSYREIVDRLVAVLREGTGPGRPAAGRSGEAPAAEVETRPTELVATPDTPSRRETLRNVRRAASRPLAVAAAGVVLLAAVFVLLVVRGLPGKPRDAGEGAAPARARTPASAAAAAGGLKILATPWARVVSITEVRTGRRVPLEAGATTPQLLTPLAPGSYRVVLSCPALRDRTVERAVNVAPGPPTLLAETFLGPEALLETLK